MALIRFKWNGGIVLGPKEAGAVVAFLFLVSGGWWEFRSLEKAFSEHIAEARPMIDMLKGMHEREAFVSRRLDLCCPLYHPEGISPKDLFPPNLEIYRP
jgi:hypothetical protein